MVSTRMEIKKRQAHEGLVEDIRRQIHDGTLRASCYLLSERDLAEKYKVSSRAVRQGLAKLESQGLISRQQGRGTVVLEPPEEHGRGMKSIAVIFQGRVRDTSTAEELDQLQQTFGAEGYGTTLYVADGNPEKEAQIVRQLSAAGMPGLVLFSAHPSDSDAHLRAALEGGMKIATFDHEFPNVECNFVGIDDRLAGFEAAEHLIRLGCPELLLINSQRNWTTHVLRQQGFKEAARKWKIPYKTLGIPIMHGARQFSDDLRRELPAIMRQAARPLGIVAWWDEAGLQAIDCLREQGWRVPEDAAVVGFANDRRGETAEIPLTTMAIARREIASMAAAAVMGQIRDPSRPSQRIRLKARMIIRQSCGTYRRGEPEATAAAKTPAAVGVASGQYKGEVHVS